MLSDEDEDEDEEELPSPSPQQQQQQHQQQQQQQHAPNHQQQPLDFGTYMAAKSSKLRLQFDEQRAEKMKKATASASTNSANSEIFSGVVIHVNGITVPCALVSGVERVAEKPRGEVRELIVL